MPLQSEDLVHKEIKTKLEETGWLNGNELLKFKENTLVEGYYFLEFLEKKVKEINKEFFSSLTLSEEKDVLNFIHNELKNATEERFLEYIKYGVPVVVNNETRIVWLVDYSNRKNTFFYLYETKFRGSPENVKPDFTLFINGIPIIVIEVKSEAIPASHTIALDQIRRYEIYSPELFRFVQFGVAYGDEKYYTPTLPNWEKRIRDLPAFNWIVEEYENGKRIRKNDIFDLLKPERVVEFLKYFIFFLKPKEGETGKLIARQNQYRAKVRAINRIKEYMEDSEKNRGLIWHWQGSGKTYTMFFIANYFLDLYYSTHPVVFFVVDREDLENQHERVLKAVQDVKFRTLFEKVESIRRLGEIIKIAKESEISTNIIPRGVYLTTIQKFQKKKKNVQSEGLSEEEDREVTKELYTLLLTLANRYLEHLKNTNKEKYLRHIHNLENLDEKAREKYLLQLGGVHKKNILFLIDETHRSHYGLLGAMRKMSFPESITFGFTGTPIFKDERNTFLEFSYPEKGEYYLDVYFIEDSIKDGFTLPIAYHVVKEGEVKAEGVRIKLTEEEIAGFIKEYMEKKGRIEEVLEAQISRKDIGKYITKARVILLNEKRIDKLAKYITERIEEDTENFKFKAMIVAVNRVGCVRYKRALDKYLVEKFGEEAKNWAEIVMTYNYNDTEPEIVEYKEELIKREKNNDLKRINAEIQNDFLEKENPKILIVTDMLLTGFDAPILKVMYLDKPLYEHRLLQAIARVNRPHSDKEFGLIVDSFGLMDHLVKTMAIYSLLAEEEIRKDFEMNLMQSMEQKFFEFECKFKQLKEELRDLEVAGENIGIDIEMVKVSLKTGIHKEDLQTKLSTIAMYYSEGDKPFSIKIVKLLNDLKTLLKTYSALGAYPEKLVYVEDIETLAYVYYKLKRIISGSRVKLGKEFWEELLKYIHNQTIVEEFREVGKATLSPEKVEELIEDLTDEEEIRKKVIKEVADFYFNLRAWLSERLHDPVCKEIIEKLERLRLEWISRIITTKTYLARLKVVNEEVEEYKRKIEKPDAERILETLSHYIALKTGKRVQLNRTEKVIGNILNSGKIKIFIPQHEKAIRTAMLQDLFLAGIEEKEAENLVKALTEEYLKEELERLWKN